MGKCNADFFYAGLFSNDTTVVYGMFWFRRWIGHGWTKKQKRITYPFSRRRQEGGVSFLIDAVR